MYKIEAMADRIIKTNYTFYNHSITWYQSTIYEVSEHNIWFFSKNVFHKETWMNIHRFLQLHHQWLLPSIQIQHTISSFKQPWSSHYFGPSSWRELHRMCNQIIKFSKSKNKSLGSLTGLYQNNLWTRHILMIGHKFNDSGLQSRSLVC